MGGAAIVLPEVAAVFSLLFSVVALDTDDPGIAVAAFAAPPLLVGEIMDTIVRPKLPFQTKPTTDRED